MKSPFTTIVIFDVAGRPHNSNRWRALSLETCFEYWGKTPEHALDRIEGNIRRHPAMLTEFGLSGWPRRSHFDFWPLVNLASEHMISDSKDFDIWLVRSDVGRLATLCPKCGIDRSFHIRDSWGAQCCP